MTDESRLITHVNTMSVLQVAYILYSSFTVIKLLSLPVVIIYWLLHNAQQGNPLTLRRILD